MTTKSALCALLALWGVGGCLEMPAVAGEAVIEEASAGDSARRTLANRVWVINDADAVQGFVRLFLADGTLVEDSAFGAHRLGNWTMVSPSALAWTIDGADVAADIVSLSDEQLIIRLPQGRSFIEEHYTASATLG